MLFSEFCKSFCAPICNSGCKIFLAEFEISDRSTTSSTKSHRFVLAAGPCCVCQMTAQDGDAQQCCLLLASLFSLKSLSGGTQLVSLTVSHSSLLLLLAWQKVCFSQWVREV